MLITVMCPRCLNSYHVQDELRGKSMRCLNPACRNVFAIDEAEASSRPGRQSGAVGDMVPLISSETPPGQSDTTHVSDLLEVLPAEPAVEAPWMAPPPVRRPAANGEPAPPEPAPAPAPAPKPPPRKTKAPPAAREAPQPPSWEAPPVRRGPPAGAEGDPAALPPTDDTPIEEKPHAPRSRWAIWVILPLALVTLLSLGGGVYLLIHTLQKTEADVAEAADKEYAEGKFRRAAELYKQLMEKYPASESLERYRFLEDLSGLRLKAAEAAEAADGSDVRAALDHVEAFLKDHARDPLLPEFGRDVGSSLVKLLTAFAGAAEGGLTDDSIDPALKTLDRAAPVVKLARAIKVPRGAGPAPDWAGMEASFARLREAVARRKERQGILAALRDMATTPSYPTIAKTERFIKEKAERFPDLPADPEVQKLLKDLYRGHHEGVRYVRAAGTVPAAAPGEDEPGILFGPLIDGTPGPAPASSPIALALVRGVLYALSASTGEMRWAVRVGIDTTALPVRVPAIAGTEERILVLSSDTATLSALDPRGNTRWRYRLGTPVLGRPIVVDRRAYLATYSGEVHEIELNGGNLLGRYLLGQRLTLGGSHEPRTRRVYFPADDGCVYVLDVGKQACEQIVYSRHPSGSLRGEPVVVPRLAEGSPGYLVLTQADGLDRVRLRVWEVAEPDRPPVEKALTPGVELAGWTWFSPPHDPEKIVLLSDAGELGLVGINQPGNNDQSLFSMLPGGGLPLHSLLWPGAASRPPSRGRAEVAQVHGNDLWVAAEGRIHRLRLAWDPAVGPRVTPAWPAPLDVGSPIHASQVIDDPPGRSSLVLVTQPEGRSCAWASRIDDATGKMMWRRQIGLVSPREPVALTRPGRGPVWLALDQGAGLFALDPARYPVGPATRWLKDPKMQPLAASLAENADQGPVVLTTPDRTTAYALAFPGSGLDLVVRQVAPTGPAGALQVREGTVKLTARLAGAPALLGDRLLLPLANGSLARLPVPVTAEANELESGPTWRTDRAGTEAASFIVPLDDSRFVSTDGARGLAVWKWEARNLAWEHLPPQRAFEEPTLALDDRVTGLVRVPGKVEALAVSDSSGALSLIDVQPNGALKVRRRWPLGGQVTTGPFVHTTAAGVRLGCVVDRSRLVWIDPAANQVAWTYATAGKDAIVGTPQVADGLVVVADHSGSYVGLDAATGAPAGEGYPLRGSLAAVASPVPFQADRLLAPLSDGTMMLLSIDRLRGKKGRPPVTPSAPTAGRSERPRSRP